MRDDTLYINFGFWDAVRTDPMHPQGHFNRMIEEKVTDLGGIKSLYSDSFYPEKEFWELYGGNTCRLLKDRYDPDSRAQGPLPEMCAAPVTMAHLKKGSDSNHL